eukprot:CAMPEP_0203667298 /NCGR_PEP_ID=MMETSP0090-20130426/4163_1 /ASSEMBLY_ACC=CAM_ASM_001088 /TAXON_ID=426623 /ORGANISM="Chaetoceros affinis, Strain CCMP159" /LENGTH=1303 /DNA_ID=CAMNT_0050531417 /DNA_START=107 /DNA_END=4018 /DNA_ORIENTATION=-
MSKNSSSLSATSSSSSEDSNTNNNNMDIIQERNKINDGSILFQPHRTIGLISTSQPYSISKDKTQSHLDTFVTVPLQERFVIYKCDSLKPVLVSNHLPGTKKKKKGNRKSYSKNSYLYSSSSTSSSSKGEKMFHAVSDSSLGITVATHGYKGRWSASHMTLYKRTKCIDTREVVKGTTSGSSSGWGVVQILNLGRSRFPISKRSSSGGEGHVDAQGAGEDKMENCLLLAMICAKHSFYQNSNDDDDIDDGVKTVGYDSSDSDSEETSSSDDDDENSSSDSSDDETEVKSSKNKCKEDKYQGEIVIVIASRYDLTIQKRIPLHHVPNFTPSVSVHPHTYLNKILIGSTNGELILLNIRSGKIIHQFKCFQNKLDRNHGKITVLEQSPAVDTLAVGTESGKVHLVNIRMDVKLFTLTHDATSKYSSGQRKAHGITSLSFRTDASALEHGIAPLAVGQMNGTISVWDLTPRSNADSDDDDYAINLMEGRRTLLCQMENAHPGGVCRLNYLPQEPLLLSSGIKSNSLVMHIFDNPNHTGRILRQRAGHVSPPSLIRYQYSSNGGILASMADGTDAASCQILSCGSTGDHSLRLFSTARSVLDREFSQGKGLTKKASDLGLNKADLYLSEIVGLATCEARSRDWGDLVSIHKNHAMAYVWSTKRKAQCGPVLRQEGWNVSAMKVQPPKSAHATALAISSCGNFAVIGTKGGVIYKYNIQSGLPRGSFPRDATNKEIKRKTQAAGNVMRTTKMLERGLKIHKLREKEKDEDVLRAEKQAKMKILQARHQDAEVVGLAIDTLNKTLVSVGSDSKLILWSFATHAPHRRSPIRLSAPATKLVHSRDSNLLAIALEDYSVIMFDCSSLAVVRKFSLRENFHRHTGIITDLAFGPDGRKLFTSSLDGSLRVWDVPTSTCVDWMTFASAPTSLALSSTGEFLATSHQGRLGISLWCDRTFFQTVYLGVQPPTKPFQMDEPAAVAEEEDRGDLELRAKEMNESMKRNYPSIIDNMDTNDDDSRHLNPVPKKEGLITLSGLPAAHWKNLFHLELVKERNKPKEAPKKPPSAPFFLQWRAGETMALREDKNDQTKKNDDEEWDAAWSDDDDEKHTSTAIDFDNCNNKRKSDIANTPQTEGHDSSQSSIISKSKRKKVTHTRSDLVSILQRCSQDSNFEAVTEYLASMGPSAIDVAFSTLCHGMHDLEEGLPLLHLASLWLLEACQTKKNYEVINAYIHRFLHIHSSTISGVDASRQQNGKPDRPGTKNYENNVDRQLQLELLDSIKKLRTAHHEATERMRNKLQQSLCLLRHFSRIV